MNHKGYLGRVAFDDDAGIFHGQIVNIRDVVTFQGTTVEEIRQAFRVSVDDYLAFCAERGEEPDKPFSGKFVVRVAPDLQRKVSEYAKRAGVSFNTFVKRHLQDAVARPIESVVDAPASKKRRKNSSPSA